MSAILVIENETKIRKNIQEILELFDFDVLGAENGLLGLELAKKHLPDLIICDVMMPVMDGFRVLKELKQDSQTNSIPLIFLSGQVNDLDIMQGLKLGAAYYLAKPFTIDRLLEAVNNTLEQTGACQVCRGKTFGNSDFRSRRKL